MAHDESKLFKVSGFSRVHRESESGLAGKREEGRVFLHGKGLAVRTGKVDADNTVGFVPNRFLNHNRVLRGTEGAVDIYDEAGVDLRILHHGSAHAPERRENNEVEVALAGAVALHRSEAEFLKHEVALAVSSADD